MTILVVRWSPLVVRGSRLCAGLLTPHMQPTEGLLFEFA